MNNINFPIEGPMMDGTWSNPHTGDSFTVRDTYFQDNQLMVSTTDGRMLDYNTIQDYIKTDKPFPKPTNNHNDHLPTEVSSLIDNNGMLEEDLNLIKGQNLYNKPYTPVTTPLQTESLYKKPIRESEDQRLVERVLSRQQQPSINCNINWTKFPQKQMDVLMDMMGVDIKDVCDFYISKINLSDIRESIKKDIEHFINVAMGYIEPEVIDPKTSSVSPEMVEEVSDTTPTNDPSKLELQEFPIERPEKPQKKTTKPTTKKTTKKK